MHFLLKFHSTIKLLGTKNSLQISQVWKIQRKINHSKFYFSQRDTEQKNAEDVLFDMFRNEATNLLNIGKFLAALRTTGIRRNDPRIQEMMDNLKKVHKTNNYESGSPETQNLNRETFKAYVFLGFS